MLSSLKLWLGFFAENVRKMAFPSKYSLDITTKKKLENWSEKIKNTCWIWLLFLLRRGVIGQEDFIVLSPSNSRKLAKIHGHVMLEGCIKPKLYMTGIYAFLYHVNYLRKRPIYCGMVTLLGSSTSMWDICGMRSSTSFWAMYKVFCTEGENVPVSGGPANASRMQFLTVCLHMQFWHKYIILAQ